MCLQNFVVGIDNSSIILLHRSISVISFTSLNSIGLFICVHKKNIVRQASTDCSSVLANRPLQMNYINLIDLFSVNLYNFSADYIHTYKKMGNGFRSTVFMRILNCLS